MWIKEIILEGFKSYASRTVISGYDSQFNAITGLNGSGKSNILDAILFCLGLSKDYDLLRIRKIQELIYKNGAAGITKAEVTIIFDNSDKSNSPSGYEEFEKITVTRQITAEKSKYYINGHSETQKNYKNMFRSVQLNIDNPHFLVAQGKITKVINLKPSELISMLEETAGTSLYNEKKREAQRTIEKKEEKLRQCTELIEHEIKPQMDQLIKEKNIFLIWRSQESEKMRLEEEVFSYEYVTKQKQLGTRKEEVGELREALRDAEEKQRGQKKEVQELERQMEEKNKERLIQQNYEEVDAEYRKAQSEASKVQKELEFAKKSRENMENEKFQLEQFVKTAQGEVERLELKKEVAEKNLLQMKGELEAKKELHEEQLRQKKQAEQGHSSNEEAQVMIQQAVRDNQKKLNQHRSDLAQIEDRVARLDDQLDNQKSVFEKAQKDQSAMQTKLTILNNEIANLEKELEGAIQAEHEFNEIKQAKIELERDVLELKNKVATFPSYMSLDLSRIGNYDKRRVYGKILELIQIKDDAYLKAIELGAGNKLQNIVVDDEHTSAYLLQNNVFTQHVYIIPNSKIQYNSINPQLITAANDIATHLNGFARPAIDLVNYSKHVENSINFVFGTFFVTSSMEIANKIAYHPLNRFNKVVTKDGDIVDPSGTITGGYVNDKMQMLPRYQQLARVKKEQRQCEEKLEEVTEKFNAKKKDQEFRNQLMQELQNKKYEYEQIHSKQNRSSNMSHQTNHQKYRNERADLVGEREKLEGLIEATSQKLGELENDLRQMKSGKSANVLVKEQLTKTVAEMEKLKKQINQTKQELSSLNVDQENSRQEISKGQKKIRDEEKNLQDAASSIARMAASFEQQQGVLQKLEESKNKLELQSNHFTTQLKQLQMQLQQARNEYQQYEDDAKHTEHEINKNNKEIFELKNEIKQLEQKYEFLNKDLDPNKDFGDFEYQAAKERLARLEHEQNKLSKQVNFKVEAMTEQVEKEFKQLEDKKRILLRDKDMLESNMLDLDEKKTQTLEKCFLDVSKYFQSIFNSIYPEGQATLSKLPDQPIEDGLELNISINHQLKQLPELSGGQRSLVALSFILALLKYKPAPFYILDEVDSALDLSHTENIGYMLSQNFKQSQFLLISLKEGMYQNANVLYKVYFQDGISKIDRYALKEKKKGQKQK